MCKECGGTCGASKNVVATDEGKTILFRDAPYELVNQVITKEGYLQANIKMSRIGIQDYSAFELGMTDVEPDKLIRVYRPESEVFKQESMDSFYGKPVTDDHPQELVTIDNIDKLMRGFVCDKVSRDGIHTVSRITITNKDLISKVQSGEKKEISAGYESKIVIKGGVTENGEIYDAIQTNIIGNHVAIVESGRCGDSCKIQDSKGDKTMSTSKTLIKIGDNEFRELPSENADLFKALLDKCSFLESELKTLKDKAKKDSEEEEKKKDSETPNEEGKKDKSKKDSESEKKEDSDPDKNEDSEKTDDEDMEDEEVEKKAEERSKVSDFARKVISDFDPTGKTVLQIKKAVIAHKMPKMQLDSANKNYIVGLFDMLVASHVDHLGNFTKHLDKVTSQIKDVKMNDSVPSTYDQFVERNQNAWKLTKEAK